MAVGAWGGGRSHRLPARVRVSIFTILRIECQCSKMVPRGPKRSREPAPTAGELCRAKSVSSTRPQPASAGRPLRRAWPHNRGA